MHPLLPVVAISVGASVGALARWGLGLWLSPGGLIPWGTLAANLIGGYLIGICLAVVLLYVFPGIVTWLPQQMARG